MLERIRADRADYPCVTFPELANVAEESLNPQRDLTRGFLLAMGTLVLLCAFTFVSAVGVSGWEGVVFDEAGLVSDSPLPLALQKIGTEKHSLYSLIIVFGVFGLVASFHGLLLAAGRSTYEFCRLGNGPALLGKIQPIPPPTLCSSICSSG